MNEYITAALMLNVPLSVLFFVKWKLADKKRKEYLDLWSDCTTTKYRLMHTVKDLKVKLREFQSKQDKHKKEQASWNKQRINLKKRIKELEEKYEK